jgi:hypothetical protein
MRRFILPLLLLAISVTAVGCDENGNGIPDDQETEAITNTDLGAQSSRPTNGVKLTRKCRPDDIDPKCKK